MADKLAMTEMFQDIVAEAAARANKLPKKVRHMKAGEHTLRVTSTTKELKNDHGEITISGSAEDVRKMELMMMGVKWTRRGRNELETSEAYHELPAPVDDPQLKDHWPIDPVVTPNTQYTLFLDEEEHEKQARAKRKLDFRSIYVSGIQAYAPMNVYQARAQRLEETGFICMRSRRGDNGKYWEIWYLAGPASATGALKGQTTEYIIDWLCKHVGPGSISVEGVHWGAVLD